MIKQEIVDRLLAVNRHFYQEFAGPFAETRARPQDGFYRLLDYLPEPCDSVLDVGCGDGRLGRFLLSERRIRRYTGVDFSPDLLMLAEKGTAGHFEQRDLSRPECLKGLGSFQFAACLSTMQHIPGRINRQRLLGEIKDCLEPGGRIALSNWQFMDNARQRRKVVDWSRVGLGSDHVEPYDYLLTWQRGGSGLRYVAFIDARETEAMAAEVGLRIVGQFRSDGRENDLNLYTVLA